MILTEDQTLAVTSMFNHVTMYTALFRAAKTQKERDELKKHQCYVLTGYAGTGKSVVIKALYDELSKLMMPAALSPNPIPQSISGVITAFTGRACENLNEKGVPCSTSHSLFYEPVVDEKGNLKYFKPKSVDEVNETIGDFAIIEEASMMDLAFIDKVMSTGKPIIFVGDDAQLPPINGESIFDVIGIKSNYKCSAMMMLEEIKRTSDGSTINLLADKMRRNGSFNFKVTNDDVEQLGKRNFNLKWLKENWNQWNVILCGTNKTRKKYNQLVRVAGGFGDDLPEIGERIVCLKNTVVANTRVNNGELYEVKMVFRGKKVSSFQVQKTIGSGASSGPLITVMVDNNMWDEERRLEENFSRRDLQDFTYGYALTVHKMQGSSMPNVIFYDEDVSFFLSQQKFRYTGITRPSKKLLVVL